MKTFVVKDGKTYIAEGECAEWDDFGDFAVKFSAELTEQGRSSEGYWLCQCTSLVNRVRDQVSLIRLLEHESIIHCSVNG